MVQRTRKHSTTSSSSMSVVDKYRKTLNLPAAKKQNNTVRSQGKVVISEQAARLIALSIRGLLNS